MKQTIEIEVPEGKKAVWKDGKVYFIDDTPKLPKTWEEFCKSHPIKKGECYISNCSTIEYDRCGCRLSYSDGNTLPSFDAAKTHLALMQLHQLRDCYRQGWKPAPDEYSYNIILWKDGDYMIDNYWHRSDFLSFQSQEIAKEFLNNFRDLIEQAGDLI